MRESNLSLAKRLYKKVKESPNTEVNEAEAVLYIENQISWQMDEAFKMIKNIDQTSFNKQDRAERLIELEAKFGIPKTHLILK